MNTLVYDEEAEAAFYYEPKHKLIQKLCPHLSFVNASLHTHPTKELPFGVNIASGYGVIRFCRVCKKIDCMHEFEDEIIDDAQGAYCVRKHLIGHCQKCGRRIYRTSWTVYLGNDEAMQLMHNIAKANGIEEDYQKLGSYWYCELRTQVSQLMDAGETERAEIVVKEFLGVPTS
jgi:hypothetical protein